MAYNQKLLLYLSRIAEVYPIGHTKYAPGTIASLIAVIIGYILLINFNLKFYLIFLFCFIVVSYILCEAHIKLHNIKDPKELVVDEFSGQFISILACVQSEKINYVFLSLISSFILFRFFDITKVGLIKKLENLPNGIGIMADDIAAGLYAFIIQVVILTSFNQPMIIENLWN